MGNSMAYPVLRTSDAAEAYAQAKRLCAVLEEREDEVWFYAELRTAAELRRMAEVLPGADFDFLDVRTDPATGEYLRYDLDVSAVDDRALEAHLPLSVMQEVPGGGVEERFVAALGQSLASLEWHGVWPDDPEADSFGWAKYDGVQVVFHGDHAQWAGWAEHHTVFVHVTKFGDLPRAQKLAALIGGEVLGEPQLGW
ncbi:hypothetical protein [Streptomyces olivochromogenes]|uniref:hypothetical protein n=1 Tax=Streptomyces olivochromogenes TaxID=1963 RepID=UPI001F165568|nr:hypothetical protein [Streptomyces olivochromogenes]MCF3132279.1 hypothetical protein [Streptomyces olivochromogenes]